MSASGGNTRGSNIKREAGHEGLFQSLVRSKESPNGVFDTMREAMTFLASLGFHGKCRRPLKGKTLILDGAAFENPQTQLFLLSISAAHEQDRRLLKSELQYAPPEAYAAFEEYVNGGLALLAEWRKSTKHPENIAASLIEFLKDNGFLDSDEAGLT